MKHIVLLSLLMPLLSSCGVVNQLQLKSAVERTMTETQNNCVLFLDLSSKEANAWIDTSKESNDICWQGEPLPLSRDKIGAISQCSMRLWKEKVRPLAYSKRAYDRMVKAMNAAGSQYAEGTLSWEDYIEKRNGANAKYLENARKGKYFSYTTCVNAIVQREIMPVYRYNYLLTQYMADASAFARKADKQKMEKEDFLVGAQKLWANFVTKEQGAMAQAQAQQSAAWQRVFENIQQLENTSNGDCGSISIPPLGTVGCKNVCINGRWAEVC